MDVWLVWFWKSLVADLWLIRVPDSKFWLRNERQFVSAMTLRRMYTPSASLIGRVCATRNARRLRNTRSAISAVPAAVAFCLSAGYNVLGVVMVARCSWYVRPTYIPISSVLVVGCTSVAPICPARLGTRPSWFFSPLCGTHADKSLLAKPVSRMEFKIVWNS